MMIHYLPDQRRPRHRCAHPKIRMRRSCKPCQRRERGPRPNRYSQTTHNLSRDNANAGCGVVDHRMEYFEFRAMNTQIVLAAEGDVKTLAEGFEQTRAYIAAREAQF